MKARGCQKLVQTKHTSIPTRTHSHSHTHACMHAHTHINTKGDRVKHQHLCLADAGGRKEATSWTRDRAISPAGTADPFGLGTDTVFAFQCQPLSWRPAAIAKCPPKRLVFSWQNSMRAE